MPVWRCPHCGTPQAESSRCWVCRRSTTTCATCRHFRHGIAGGLGLCGLDPRRSALDGSEIRACWTAALPSTAEADPLVRPLAESAPATTDRRPTRTFVPVDELQARVPAVAIGGDRRLDADELVPVSEPVPAGPAPAPGSNAWSLWGEVEP